MKTLIIICLFRLIPSSPTDIIDQRPDLLIIGNDTILLKSFPLEELGFQIRPFLYGNYDFPDEDCYRGYQAVWKVIGNKLFLAEIIKADDTRERIDIRQYFLLNDYIPVVIDGLIFADWFTKDLTSFPRNYIYWGCVWKSRTKKQRTSIRFQNGVMTSNRYHNRR